MVIVPEIDQLKPVNSHFLENHPYRSYNINVFFFAVRFDANRAERIIQINFRFFRLDIFHNIHNS